MQQLFAHIQHLLPLDKQTHNNFVSEVFPVINKTTTYMLTEYFTNKYRTVSKKKIARIILAIEVVIAMLLLAIILFIIYLI